MWFQNILQSFYFNFFHSLLKWLTHKITGQCELLRIIYGYSSGAYRTYRIESSAKHSKQLALKQVIKQDDINVDDTVEKIMDIKSVSANDHPQFGPALKVCICQICGYRKLIMEVESIRKIAFSSENPDHEADLMKLWHLLCPDTPLESRINKQWTDIGFQGDDPMTDFRGMGLLGLKNLLFFASQHEDTARQLLSHSNHPQYSYSFAIVGINLTHMALRLLTEGHLKTHLYNFVHGRPLLEHFHQVYCYLFVEFDHYWFAAKPKNIMEFSRIRDEFQTRVVNDLRDRSTVLQTNIASTQTSNNLHNNVTNHS